MRRQLWVCPLPGCTGSYESPVLVSDVYCSERGHPSKKMTLMEGDRPDMSNHPSAQPKVVKQKTKAKGISTGEDLLRFLRIERDNSAADA